MTSPSVLVAARDHDLRATIQIVLQQEGCWVLTVADRFEAACMLNSFTIVDHVIVDQPVLVELVRSHSRFKDLPVTLLSSVKRVGSQEDPT